MTIPLVALALLSVVGGWVGIPLLPGGDRIGEFLSPILLPLGGEHPAPHHASVPLELILMGASVAAAAVGLTLAYLWYAKDEGRTPARIAAAFPRAYRAIADKYRVDELYDAVFVEGVAKGGGRFLWDFDATVVDGAVNGTRHATVGVSWISSIFDQYVVDGLVNGVADTLQAGFRVARRSQIGRVQNYALVMGGGLFAIVAVYLLFR